MTDETGMSLDVAGRKT